MIQLATETAHGEIGGIRLAGLRTWLAHFKRRRAFNRMLALDDRMLEDVGVLRAEVEFASRLPLAVNAATRAHAPGTVSTRQPASITAATVAR